MKLTISNIIGTIVFRLIFLYAIFQPVLSGNGVTAYSIVLFAAYMTASLILNLSIPQFSRLKLSEVGDAFRQNKWGFGFFAATLALTWGMGLASLIIQERYVAFIVLLMVIGTGVAWREKAISASIWWETEKLKDHPDLSK